MEHFSVLMSVYFKENPIYFESSLKSNLVNQSLKPSEFVLVCDGVLTPELESVIVKYQELFPQILKVYRKENGGLGNALNYGLPKCSFPLIARADSDDICTPDRYELQVKYMNEHPNVGIISSYIDEFDTDCDNPIHLKTLPLQHEELYEMSKFRCPLNHMAVMMRKDEILRIGSYHHIPYIEDYELWVRAIVNGIKLGNVGKVLVHARIGNGMIQRRGTKKYIKSWYILNRYMVANKMINNITHFRNMLAVTTFVFIPPQFKGFLYRNILRKS